MSHVETKQMISSKTVQVWGKTEEALENIADLLQNNSIFNVARSRFWDQGGKNRIICTCSDQLTLSGMQTLRFAYVTSHSSNVAKTEEEIAH